MAYTITEPQKRLMRELLKVGRWNNESEIVRYGLHLVAKEVEADQHQSLEPYPPSVLKRAYREMTRQERAEERRLESASARPSKGELD
jgi:Arc/MetJ-type ribon-helix-helix transcriptional regulator